MPLLKLNLTKTIRLSLHQVEDSPRKAALIKFLNTGKPDLLVDITLADILLTDDQPSTQPTPEGGTDA